MNKLFSLLILILFSQYGFAEDGQGCRGQGKLVKKLGLEDNQIETVQQIMSEQREKRHDLFQTNRNAIKDKMETLHEETKNRLSSVLTAEQMEKFEQIHAERKQKREQRREKRRQKFNETSQTVES